MEIKLTNSLLYSSKISRYTPSENTKVYDKPVHRQPVPNFNPKSTIEIINNERSSDTELTDVEKKQLLQQYLDVSWSFLKYSDYFESENMIID